MSGAAWARNGVVLLVSALICLAMLTSGAGAQTTLYVDDDAPGDPGPGDPTVSDPDEDGSAEHPFDAIQEGIDAAVDGDVIEVADGTHTGAGNRDVDFGGKAITVRSASGEPALCIIDCEGSYGNQHRAFCFHNGEGSDSVVEGLTITNGFVWNDDPLGANGGGVYCTGNSSPTLTDCTIDGNYAEEHGGGVYCTSSSSPTLTNCIISENLGAGEFGRGGGILCSDGSNPTLTDCTISGNRAVAWGGGVYCSGSSPTLANCTISENKVYSIDSRGGGGVFCGDNSSPTLTNCTISGNRCDTEYCTRGGGVYCSRSSPKLTNCTINGNHSCHGGGVYCASSSPTLINCTITGNEAANSEFVDGWAGGVYGTSNSSPTLTNCVLWANTPPGINRGAVVRYCDIEGGAGGTGNIDADPLFVDPAGPDNDPSTWQDNDYRLRLGCSPCIDAGDNASVPADTLDLDGDGDTTEPLPFDLDGSPRFVDDLGTPDTGNGTPPIVDMGAHEAASTDLEGDDPCDSQLDDDGDGAPDDVGRSPFCPAFGAVMLGLTLAGLARTRRWR